MSTNDTRPNKSHGTATASATGRLGARITTNCPFCWHDQGRERIDQYHVTIQCEHCGKVIAREQREDADA